MKTHTHSAAAFIETLEPRLAPAGIVTLSISGGVLTITGDGGDNGIAITHLPESQGPGASTPPGVSAWQISDPTGTGTQFKFNGQTLTSPFNIPAQDGIKADLKDGADRIDILPSEAPSGMVLTGVLSVIGGKGNDSINVGSATGQQVVVGGAATFDLGDGDDTLEMDASVIMGGTVSIKGGAGGDDVNLLATGDHVFLKGLTVDLGAGEDSLSVTSARLEVLGALAIKGTGVTGKATTVTLAPTLGNVEGAVTVGVAGGTLTAAMGSGQLRLNSGLAVTGSAVVNEVTLNGAVTVGGALSLDLKGAVNRVTLASNSSLQAASVTLKTGAGVDTLDLQTNSTLVSGGALTLNMGDNVNQWRSFGGASVTAGSVIFTGTAGTDIVSFDGANLTVLGHVTLNAGAGTNILGLEPAASGFIGGNLTINGTTGVDNVTFDSPNFRILGNVTVASGEGSNTLILSGGAFHVNGGLSFTAGKGVDTFLSSNSNLVVGKIFSMSAGDGASNTAVLNVAEGSLGSLVYKGGSGSDNLILGNLNGTSTTRLTITGGVTAAMGADIGGQGAAPKSQVTLTDVVLHGALNVTMSGLAARPDEVVLNQSRLDGVVNITQGAGASTLSVHDSLMRGNFTARLGAGADTLNLDTGAGTGAVNTWMGTLYVDMDTGIDTINIGSATNEANARNHFYRLATIDTGDEADVYAAHNNHTFFAGAELRVQEI